MVDMDATDSAYLKAALAVDNDLWFERRLQIVCAIEGIEYSKRLAYMAAETMPDEISLSEEMVVDTSAVTDDKIRSALKTQWAKIQSAEPEPEPADMATFAQIDAAITGFTTNLLEDTGREMGKPWQQPTGAHDAYPKGWVSSHEGKVWESLVPFNVWAPGVSGWREIPSKGNIPAWVQPSGAHDAYKVGDQVTHKDSVWTSNIDGNVWEPGTGDLWLDLGPML